MENINFEKDIEKKITLGLVEEALKDNKFEFEHAGAKYKVKHPTAKDRALAHQETLKKYTELIVEGQLKTSEELKKIYKKRGIDIDTIETQILVLTKELSTNKIRLGEMQIKEVSETEMKPYVDKITELQEEVTALREKKINLMSPSIENTANVHGMTYLTFLLTEKIEGGKVWGSFEEMLSYKDETLVNIAAFYTSIVASTNATT